MNSRLLGETSVHKCAAVRAGWVNARNKVKIEGQVIVVSVFGDPIFRLKISHSITDVAHVLGMEPAKFFYVVQNADNGSYYRKFQIPKKTGGFREISQPLRGLGIAQTKLNKILLKHYRKKDYVKGYVKGTSFVENAAYHQSQRWVLNFDVKDFFPSIGFGRVRGMFMSELFGFNPNVATILARICTFENGLPQGARTSPILSNFIAHNLDKHLLAIARKNRLKFSRYADDITYSSSNRRIPIGVIKDHSRKYETGEVELGNEIVDAFSRSGFKINDKKTRLQLRSDRQEVTGLVVNERANVRRKDVERIRLVIHSLKTHGPIKASELWTKSTDASAIQRYIVGWLAHVRQVRGTTDPVLAKLCKGAFDAGITDVGWIERTAEMINEFDVFLSHASEDKPKVRLLYEKLDDLGVKVFFDESSIQWGDSIVEKINFGLLRSRFFMPFLTPTFQAKGWTNKELNSAISNSASQKARILPIKAEGFEIGSEYPLLNNTLYKVWPADSKEKAAFITSVAAEVQALVAKVKT